MCDVCNQVTLGIEELEHWNVTIDEKVEWGKLPVFVYCAPYNIQVLHAKLAFNSMPEASWDNWTAPDIKIKVGSMSVKGEDTKQCAYFYTNNTENPGPRSRVFLSIETSAASSRAGLYVRPNDSGSENPKWLMWMQSQKSTDLELLKAVSGWDTWFTSWYPADKEEYTAAMRGVSDDFSEPQTVRWQSFDGNSQSSQSTKFLAYIHIDQQFVTKQRSLTFFAHMQNILTQAGVLYAFFYMVFPGGPSDQRFRQYTEGCGSDESADVPKPELQTFRHGKPVYYGSDGSPKIYIF